MKKQLFILTIMGLMTFISCKKEEEVKKNDSPVGGLKNKISSWFVSSGSSVK